ncbi:hypothetical protein C0Z17_06815 [Trinickia caryophylli]|nr:hypothetical protein C0Z17_06815 [Trinickia caryophylli]
MSSRSGDFGFVIQHERGNAPDRFHTGLTMPIAALIGGCGLPIARSARFRTKSPRLEQLEGKPETR